MAAEKKKMVYFFAEGQADGRSEMRWLLGGKGANLAEMANIGLPVPPGFTLTTEVCRQYQLSRGKWPDGLEEEVLENMARLEKVTGRRFGDAKDPLLVSVRSGAAVSMPGMMDTVLNLGCNDRAVQGLAQQSGDKRFAWDCYRRFIDMFGSVAMNIPHSEFDSILTEYRKKARVSFDSQLSAGSIQKVVERFKMLYKKHTGENLPTDPKEQLRRSINAVFGSWDNPQAIRYREINDIKGLLGTAVNVQTMVYGNMGQTSFTGVGFTRNPATGENKLYGEYLVNAQGEDVVAGIRTPKDVNKMSREDLSDFAQREIGPKSAKKLYQSMRKILVSIKKKLEVHYCDMQDFEFTGQQGKLYMLQTRTGKRTAAAAVKIAVDMKNEGLIDEKTAVMRVEPNQIEQILHKRFDQKDKEAAVRAGRQLAKGLPASPGAAVGVIALTAGDAEALAHAEKSKTDPVGVILVREETSPEDIGGMHAAVGILTARGGMTSHAAVVARGMGKCCVAGCGAIEPNERDRTVTIAGKTYKEGDVLSLDGVTGQVFDGRIRQVEAELTGAFSTLMEWADDHRKMGVRTNADTPEDAKKARELGAEGIGLCRTEHMFFDEKRISYVRQMMLSAPEVRALRVRLAAAEETARQASGAEKKRLGKELAELRSELKAAESLLGKALAELLPEQRKDFEGIFKAMDGLPVTIRLLDPPLHEFLPKDPDLQAALAKQMGLTPAEVAGRVNALFEFNPMMGHRGCRLGMTYPDIYNMQVQAIMEAAVNCQNKGITVLPEIMIPLVGIAEELRVCRDAAEKVCKSVLRKAGVAVDYKIGTMIEVPRAALIADDVAKYSEFFSFGTNDLTQMTFGFSRDDVGTFVPEYVEREVIEYDPFQSLDQTGVGQLVAMGVNLGRKARPDLKIGICGEHGGDPASVEFCYRVGMDYVSCSPYRVPVARLAAAQISIELEGEVLDRLTNAKTRPAVAKSAGR